MAVATCVCILQPFAGVPVGRGEYGFLDVGSSFEGIVRREGGRRRIRLVCGASWFDFTSDESSTSYARGKMKSGDFAILSHLKDLGCGEIIRRPQEVHFSGCINESYTFNATGGDFFIKINRTFDASSMFAGEFEALQQLQTKEVICVPTPLGYGNLPDGGSYIIMKHLQFRPFGMMQESSQQALGWNLAMLHQANSGTVFGFPMTTRLGVLPLDNRWSSNWATFFVQQRLRDRFERVYTILGNQKTELECKGMKVLEHATEILDTHKIKPSLLHGDLWMGNSGLTPTGEVAIFDPASFIGDAEFDLAFEGWTPVEHFPGFTAGFYAAYHEVLPQVEGFGKRHQLYQLFHLLNHFLIYGGEYYTHVTAMVDQILLN
ncbi:hypothetical protein BDL97_09G064300 [Sphagnum fallax]|nr:hypothetical protein BDL97_09G064300 [Sphagnum fallax]